MGKEGLLIRIERLIKPILLSEGMELVDLEFSRQGKRWYLRIYMDKKGGVNLRDCEHISHQVERVLDVEDLIPQSYVLEVSSPGLDRPLKKREDYLRYRGRLIKFSTSTAIQGRKNFVGTLKEMKEDVVWVELKGGELLQVPWPEIVKARLEVDF
ncbi:MAG: ribosome maturation factor RimP [Nitrospinae bacterium]|nr:ribosome maturation factor RimP [Nitrospinota bacterium]